MRKRYVYAGSCPVCGAGIKRYVRETNAQAVSVHERTARHISAVVVCRLGEAGWARAGTLRSLIKAAGFPLTSEAALVCNFTRPGELQPELQHSSGTLWALREDVEFASILRGVRAPIEQRGVWLTDMRSDVVLRKSVEAARRVGGPRAVLAVLRRRQLAQDRGGTP